MVRNFNNYTKKYLPDLCTVSTGTEVRDKVGEKIKEFRRDRVDKWIYSVRLEDSQHTLFITSTPIVE